MGKLTRYFFAPLLFDMRPQNIIFRIIPVAVVMFGALLVPRCTQKILYFVSSDGSIADTTKLLISLIGACCIAGGVILWFALVKTDVFRGIIEKIYHAIGMPGKTSWAAAIFISAFLLRLVWVLALPLRQVSDFAEYDAISWQLASGTSIMSPEITAGRPPGYPFFLSLIYRVSGHNQMPAKIANCFLGAILCIATYALIREISGERLARITSLLTVVHPTLVLSVTMLATEHLFAPLLLAALWLYVRSWRDDSFTALLASAAVMGIACLVRPSIYLLPIALALWVFVCLKSSASRIFLKSLIFLAIYGLVIFPWQWRNQRIFGNWGIMGTNMGVAFYFSVTPDFNEFVRFTEKTSAESANEYEADRVIFRRGLEVAKSDPGYYLKKLAFWRFRRTFISPPEWLCEYNLQDTGWSREKAAVAYGMILVGSGAVHGIVSILALVGAIAGWRRSKYNSMLLLFVAYHAALLIVSPGSPRYRYPLVPIYCYFAVLGLKWTIERLRSRETRKNGPWLLKENRDD